MTTQTPTSSSTPPDACPVSLGAREHGTTTDTERIAMPSYEYRNGELVEVPDVVITESRDLHQNVKNTLVIRSGVTLNLYGRLSGTVQVQAGATLVARSDVSGTVRVASTAQATFYEHMSGTLHVDRGGVATLAPSSLATGTMHVEGTLVNEGTRGVQVHGPGVVDDREGSTIRQPDETWEDGTTVYYG